MVGLAEVARRVGGTMTHRLSSLPILALSVHSACNCRCVMCDIWKANSEKRELSAEELAGHVADIERLHVQRVMLTGGEPLLHRNLWTLCDRLRRSEIRMWSSRTPRRLDPARCARRFSKRANRVKHRDTVSCTGRPMGRMGPVTRFSAVGPTGLFRNPP